MPFVYGENLYKRIYWCDANDRYCTDVDVVDLNVGTCSGLKDGKSRSCFGTGKLQLHPNIPVNSSCSSCTLDTPVNAICPTFSIVTGAVGPRCSLLLEQI